MVNGWDRAGKRKRNRLTSGLEFLFRLQGLVRLADEALDGQRDGGAEKLLRATMHHQKGACPSSRVSCLKSALPH